MSECITVHVSYNLSILCLYLCLKPLFLYLPHQAVHSACAGVPLEAPAKYQHKVSYIKTRTRQLYAGKKSWIGVVFVSCYCKDVTTPVHIFRLCTCKNIIADTSRQSNMHMIACGIICHQNWRIGPSLGAVHYDSWNLK